MKTLFWIYRSRIDKLGQSPVMLRLIIASEIKNISTGVKINAQAWDAQKQRIKGSDWQAAKLNQELSSIENKMLECYYSLLQQMDLVKVRFVIDRYKSATIKPALKSIPTLLRMYDLHNEEMEQLVGKVYTNATLLKYQMSRDIMKQFITDTMGKQDVELHDVTVSFVKKHDLYLRTVRNNVTNSVTKRQQRFAAWRSGGFSAQNFIRSRKFKFTKNCHTKNVRPHYAKPLLAAGVLSTVLVNHCLYVVQVSGCAFGYFFFFRRAGKFFYSIFFRETSTLFLQLWFACRLVAAAKCVCLCALAFYFANCNILYAPLATIIKTIAPIIKSG